MKKMLKQDLKMDIPDLAIDRAHRIGSVVEGPSTKKTYRHIIVRFTTWRHRTAVYRTRNDKEGHKIASNANGFDTQEAKAVGKSK